jgi:ribosomal protein S18 acetylase RimI-like enzyme
MIIRRATVGDAAAIAEVHVASWRTTYAGLLPDELLRGLSVERRRRMWHRTLTDPESKTFMFVAEDERSQIVGFVAGGPERDGNPGHQGEVYAIYILAAQQRRGLGRRLIAAAVNELRRMGFDSLLIWVLANNPAHRFYEALGGAAVAEKNIRFGEAEFLEVSYEWRSLDDLLLLKIS